MPQSPGLAIVKIPRRECEQSGEGRQPGPRFLWEIERSKVGEVSRAQLGDLICRTELMQALP